MKRIEGKQFIDIGYFMLLELFKVMFVMYFALVIFNSLTGEFVQYYINFSTWFWIEGIIGGFIFVLRKTR